MPLGSYTNFVLPLPYQNPIAVKPVQQSYSNTVSGDSTTYAAPRSEDYMSLHSSARSWEIKREQVKIIKFIGKGAFSQVAKATAWSLNNSEENTTVAVKMLKGTVRNCALSKFMIHDYLSIPLWVFFVVANAPESDKCDLLSELELMKKMKPHPHVIKLVGCVTETGKKK